MKNRKHGMVLNTHISNYFKFILMNFIRLTYFSLLFVFLISCSTTKSVVTPPVEKPALIAPTVEVSNFKKLASIKNVVHIEKRKKVSHFNENYEIWFEQLIDHNDVSKGTFKQRVFLGFENATQPVIVELRGYDIYSENTGYQYEQETNLD